MDTPTLSLLPNRDDASSSSSYGSNDFASRHPLAAAPAIPEPLLTPPIPSPTSRNDIFSNSMFSSPWGVPHPPKPLPPSALVPSTPPPSASSSGSDKRFIPSGLSTSESNGSVVSSSGTSASPPAVTTRGHRAYSLMAGRTIDGLSPVQSSAPLWELKPPPRASSMFAVPPPVPNTPSAPSSNSHPPSSVPSTASNSALPSPSLSTTSSRNSSFFTPQPILKPDVIIPPSPTSTTTKPPPQHRIEMTSLKLRLIPKTDYVLGEGQYSTVYLGSYKGKEREDSTPRTNSHLVTYPWKLCAIKRPYSFEEDIKESLLREAIILKHLHRYSEKIDSDGDAVNQGGGDVDAEGSTEGEEYVVNFLGIQHEPSPYLPTSKSTSAASSNTMKASAKTALPDLTSIGLGRPSSSPLINHRVVLVLEHCSFGTLSSFMSVHSGMVTGQLWLKWAKGLASGVDYLHRRGVIHADMKPQNVLLANDFTVRISDFGSSFISATGSKCSPLLPVYNSTTTSGLGTSAYSSPEQILRNNLLDASTDIFSLGVTLYVLITGREPYKGVVNSREVIYWAGKGEFWNWEERKRASLGDTGVRRGGSLRETDRFGRQPKDAAPNWRMGTASDVYSRGVKTNNGSLLNDEGKEISPGGGIRKEACEVLLLEDEAREVVKEPPLLHSAPAFIHWSPSSQNRNPSLSVEPTQLVVPPETTALPFPLSYLLTPFSPFPVIPSSPTSSLFQDTPHSINDVVGSFVTRPHPPKESAGRPPHYPDGSPPMYFAAGSSIASGGKHNLVPEEIRVVLRGMLNPDSKLRWGLRDVKVGLEAVELS